MPEEEDKAVYEYEYAYSPDGAHRRRTGKRTLIKGKEKNKEKNTDDKPPADDEDMS